MRSKELESGAFRIEYPEEISFCFNPEMIKITHLEPEMVESTHEKPKIFKVRISIKDADDTGEKVDTREFMGGVVWLDMSTYTKMFFEEKKALRQLGVKVKADLEIQIYEGEVVTDTYKYGFSTYCIWGALNIGDVFNPSKTLTWFRQFPFTFGFYDHNILTKDMPENKPEYRYDDENYQVCSNINELCENAGICHIDPKLLFPESIERYGVFRVLRGAGLGTFTREFDGSFQASGDGNLLIRLNIDDSKEGTYLRWVNSHGFLQYYLFQDGDLRIKTKDQGVNLLEEYQSYEGLFYNGMSRIQGKVAQQTKRLCAPLVDGETFNTLSTILTSPIVDMFCGYNKGKGEEAEPLFIPVNVADGTCTLSGAAYKDFEIEITLPETIAQRW